MDPEIWKIAIANLGIGGALAAILLLLVKQIMARDETLISQLVRAVELNSQAMTDVHVALSEIKRFMEKLDERLGRVEEKVARIEGRLEGKGGKESPRTY